LNDAEPRIRPTAHEAILRAAMQVLARNPSATTSEIAIAAGVGRATLHRHFRSRETLLHAVQARSLAETEAAVRARIPANATPAEQLEGMLDAVVPLADRFAFLAQSEADDPTLRAEYARQLEWLRTLVEGLKDADEIDGDLPTTWVVAQIDRLIWTTWSEIAAGRLAPADATRLALRTLMIGMAPKETRS